MPSHPDRVRKNYDDMCIICLANKAELFFTRCKLCMRKLLVDDWCGTFIWDKNES